MEHIRHKKFTGMNADAGPQEVPDGSVKDALNVSFAKPDVAGPRIGLVGLAASKFSAVVNVRNMVGYDDAVVMLDSSKVTRIADGGSAVEIVDEDSNSIECWPGFCSTAKARGNLYIATETAGVQKIASNADASSEDAGAPWTPSFGVSFEAGTNEWVANNYTVGYRVVAVKEDANGVITRSRPSPMVFKQNDSGVARIARITIPNLSSVFYDADRIEVYRTRSVSGVSPPAETYLAYVIDDYAGTLEQVYDELSDDDLGAALFSGNDPAAGPPPLAKCLGFYAGSLFAANITSRQFYRLALRGGVTLQDARVDVTCNVTSGSPTVTITSTDFAPEEGGLAIGQEVEVGAYFGSSGIRITNIAGSALTMSENADSSGTGVSLSFYDSISILVDGSTEVTKQVRALSLGALGDAVMVEPESDRVDDNVSTQVVVGPAVVLRELAFRNGTLAIRATNGATLYQRTIPDWESTRDAFDYDTEPALVMWSLLDKPEMFTPGIGQVWVGDQQKAVLAMESHGDRLFIFKEDGIFVLEGPSERSGFRVDRLSDHVLMTPRHVCSTEIGVAAWTDSGVIVITDGGNIANISSRRMDKYLTRFGRPSTDIGAITGNMFYEPHSNELHLVAQNISDASNDPDLSGPIHLVWNSQQNAWARWALRSDAVVGCAPGYANARLSFLTNPGGVARIWYNEIASELSVLELVHSDRVDEFAAPLAITLERPGASENIYYFDDTFTSENLPAVGDVVIKSSFTQFKLIVTDVESLGGSSYRIHLYTELGVPLASEGGSTAYNVWVLYAFTSELRLHPQSGARPGEWKQWLQHRWQLNGRTDLYKATTGAISSDSNTEDTHEHVGDFMQLAVNSQAQGSPISPRYLFSREHASAQLVEPFLRITEAGAVWEAAGVTIQSEIGSMEVSRA